MADADTAFLQRAINDAETAYKEKAGMQTHLYNGTEYVDYRQFYLKGHQFFESNQFAKGDIYYDGAWHKQVPILYDVVLDEVIIPHNSSGSKIKLIYSKVDTVNIWDHTFVQYKSTGAEQELLPPGLYDLLHQGSVKFLVKRSKNIQERTSINGMEGEFRVGDKLYLGKDSAYYQVSSKRSVYKVLHDKEKLLRKYASAQKLKFRKNKEEAILALVQYYSSLPETPQTSSK
jgi:hypothetical protein